MIKKKIKLYILNELSFYNQSQFNETIKTLI